MATATEFGARSDLATAFNAQEHDAALQARLKPRQHDPSLGETSSLRNSCDACAQAKLKCKKEKPTCSRCAKRGIPCRYLYSKRAGRKPSKPSNSGESQQQQQQPQQSEPSQHGTPLDTDASYDYFGMGAPHMATHTGRNTPSGLSDLTLSELVDFNNVDNMDLTKENFKADFEAELKGSLSADHFAPWPHNGSSSSGSTFDEPGGDAMIGGLPMDSELFSGTSLLDYHNLSAIFAGSEDHDRITPSGPEATCPCMQRALQDMQRVSHLTSEVGTLWSSTSVDGRCMLRTSLDVVRKNKDILRGILHTLACAGPHNGHLLAILSFVLSSVVNLYAIITSSRPSTPSGPSSLGSDMNRSQSASSLTSAAEVYNADQEDPVHAAAYIVFGELQQLRKSCEQLTRRLKDHAILQANVAKNKWSGKVLPPLSANICYTLETDLSRLLEELALAVIQKLT